MRAFLLLHNKKIRNKKQNRNKKICVVGVSPKSGVTHLCLCLANFLHSVMGRNVIYIELRRDSDLLNLVGLKQVRIGDITGYKYMGVKYVLTSDVDIVRNLMANEKAWIVVDMEDLNEETQAVFMNSDNRIVIGSLSPWCQKFYYQFIENNKLIINDTDRINYLLTNKTKKLKDAFMHHIGSKPIDMPIIKDPFSLKEEDFEKLIEFL